MGKQKMPKTKLKSSPSQTPESPRKTPRTTPVTTPVKGQGAGRSLGKNRGESASPSPVRRIKPAFKLEKDESRTTDAPTDSASDTAPPKKTTKPTAEPIFANKLTLKKKVDDRIGEIVNENVEKTPEKVEKPKKKIKSKTRKEKPKTEENKAEFEEPLVSGERTVCDSPHRIVIKKERKPRQPNTKKDQIAKTKKKTKKITEDDDVVYNGGARITDFFEIRRSSRKPAKVIEEERNAAWKTYLKEERIDGLEIRDVKLKEAEKRDAK